MLRYLDELGPATSTTLAEALGESTGTTSYHLRVLAGAGIIEEVAERARGRERWWRTILTDHREPDYDSLPTHERAALDQWRATQIPGELALVNRYVRDYRKHGRWARAARAGGYYTAEDLDALFDEYLALLSKYGHTARDAPPGARLMQLRMFYIPDQPAGQPQQPAPADGSASVSRGPPATPPGAAAGNDARGRVPGSRAPS